MAFVPLTTGTSRLATALPIIGPPATTCCGLLLDAARRLDDVGKAGADAHEHVLRLVGPVAGDGDYLLQQGTGRAVTARNTLAVVVTLKSAPLRAPGATSRPVTARMSCFFAPCG